MAVGTRAFKRNIQKQRVKAAERVFGDALKASEKVTADLMVCVNGLPFWKRAIVSVRILFGVWK